MNPEVRRHPPRAEGLMLPLDVDPSLEQDVPAVVAAARDAQPAWGALSVEERVKRIIPLKDRVLDQAERIAKVVRDEVGKPEVEAILGEVLPSADVVAYWTSKIVEMLDPDEVDIDSLRIPRQGGNHRTRAARRGWRSSCRGTSRSRCRCARSCQRCWRATRSSSSRAR